MAQRRGAGAFAVLSRGLLCLAVAGAAAAGATGLRDRLVVAVSGDPGHLNPAISTAGPLQQIAGSLFNGLVSIDPDGTPRGDLAESWNIAADGLTATFHLRPHAYWHDGRRVTAADVKFTFDEVLFRHHARARAGLRPAVAAIEAVDETTVRFTLVRPHPALLAQLDVTEAPILPQHVYGEGDVTRHPANLRPVGSGPFRFESYRRDDQISLVRNPAYFKRGLPYLGRLAFRIIPDPTTQVNALLAGEVDMLARVAATDASRLAAQRFVVEETTTAPGGGNCVLSLAFNLDRPALQDVRLRRAVGQAVDREALLRLVFFGHGRVARAPIASGVGFAHLAEALDGLTFDPAAANRALDAAGLSRGANDTRLALDVVHFPIFARVGEFLREEFAAIGLSLILRPQDPASLADTVFTRRDFDLALISYCQGVDPEIGARRMYHSSAVGAGAFSNASGFRDDEVDRAFDRAAAAIDLEVRSEAYARAQRRLAETLPYLWLVETNFASAWRRDLDGVRPWSAHFAERARRR